MNTINCEQPSQEMITLPATIRRLLVEKICDRINIIRYCKFYFNLALKMHVKDSYTADCPFCHGEKTFVLNKTTGSYLCTRFDCREQGDILTLMNKKDGNDPESALNFLSWYVEEREKRMRPYAGGVM